MTDTLDVMIWGRKVGTLVSTKSGYEKRICFYFDPDFVRSGMDIAPLRASIHGIAAQRGLPVYPESEKIFGGLPSFIADSMPDHWGNTVFNEWAKARGIRKKDLSALDRLAYIGTRGMGAFEFAPPVDESLNKPFRVEIYQLSELAQTAINDARNFHTRLSPTLAIESLFKVGTSAGGRRPKAVINLNIESGECYSGQVAPPVEGFTPMIIKFDEHGDVPSTRIEYSYHLMAVDAGLHMMPSLLLETDNEAHFITQRFDRQGNEKVHVQTLAAMNPLSDSYEDLFETARRLNLPHGDFESLFMQMALNILAANVDDHNKNFSFIMEKNGVWKIAPVYDFTFTVDPSAPFYVNRHSMSVNGKTEEITRQDLEAVAKRFNIKNINGLLERTKNAVEHYRSYAEKARVPEYWIKKIEFEVGERLKHIE